MTSPDDDARALLRRQALRRRRKLAELAGPAAGERLAAHGLTLLREMPGAVVSGYVPVHGEIDVMPLLNALHAAGHTLALPVVVARDAPLVFRHWRPGMALEKGAFGIPVPPASALQVWPKVVLVPLVAFDAQGHRLGYGGGYYDRTLAALRAQGEVLAVGCAFSGQEVPHIPALDTDERLDAVLTERGTRWFTGPQAPRR